MPRRNKIVVEFRSYDLPVHFPLLMVAGDDWCISDIPAGTLHFHNCLEIGLCESDSGMLAFPEKQEAFTAGDVTVIAGDVLHTTWSDPGKASKWSYLFVDPEELLRPFFPLDMLPNAQYFKELLTGFHAVFHAAEYPALHELTQSILTELREKRLNYEIAARGLFLALVTQLMRIRAQTNTASSFTGMPIAPALEYINTHYMEDFSIAEMAELCRMSQSHFRRVFREMLGVGPLEQLNRTRVLKACSLLRMTDQSILQVSELVGFRSLSSFNRHFSAVMGTSPTEWRRNAGAGRNTSILKYSGWLTPPPTNRR